ncbi:MAG: nucleotidyltransferase domain-containing protein [Anaerolineae bacterium]|nr:nucleotidyltransferase domain-containing protein [Anaerolineae bacterium]
MPVRSLSSSVLRWPDADRVHEAVQRWAEEIAARRPDVIRVGYFGSYARGDWGVGSDLDLVVVVGDSREPFTRRASRFDTTALPVPADLLVYTTSEWEAVSRRGRFGRALSEEAVWVLERPAASVGPGLEQRCSCSDNECF